MAAFFTLAQLRERLGGELHGDLSFVDALNEVGEFAYTLARWPYSSKQFQVPAADIYQDTDSGGAFEDEWFLQIDDETYDGAIRFLVDGRGYDVRTLSESFRDIPTGWAGFIDHERKVDSAGASEKRVYKCPIGVTSTSNVRCWAKKRWVDLYLDSDKYPIRSISAIRAGLKALSYQENDEIEKAEAMWNKMAAILSNDSHQFSGPKKAKIRLESPYSRNPRSFR